MAGEAARGRGADPGRPDPGPVNTGIGIFEAPDEETARAIIAEDPVTRGGFARPELRPYQLGFLRGRDQVRR